jgi:hypothetical protein
MRLVAPCKINQNLCSAPHPMKASQAFNCSPSREFFMPLRGATFDENISP